MFEVVIHCKPGCKYCDLSEKYLDNMGINYEKIIYDPTEDGYEETSCSILTDIEVFQIYT